jgi:hypothetical protein
VAIVIMKCQLCPPLQGEDCEEARYAAMVSGVGNSQPRRRGDYSTLPVGFWFRWERVGVGDLQEAWYDVVNPASRRMSHAKAWWPFLDIDQRSFPA